MDRDGATELGTSHRTKVQAGVFKTTVRAVKTPLASIFGSGFLIIVPILAGAVGPYSAFAMIGVCALAFAVGAVIRFNIVHAEPALEGEVEHPTLSFERCADLALIIAYVISVCLYIHILSSFVLGGLGVDRGINDDLLTTAVLVFIMAVGVTKGLKGLAALEKWTLILTLAIIALLLLGFARYDWIQWQSASGIELPIAPDHSVWRILTILGGTLIVVQGFETPRYMGELYDAQTRVRASSWSQVISSIVYVLFVAAALPLLVKLDGSYGDNSLIALVSFAASALVIPLIVAAAMSQFSAAVADTLTAIGNLEEITHGHLKAQWGYIFVGGGALALTWSANTLEIVAIASRAFAFYYGMQCLVAISVSRSMLQRAGFAAVGTALAFITVFAVPAS
jgi:hypothetical protein